MAATEEAESPRLHHVPPRSARVGRGLRVGGCSGTVPVVPVLVYSGARGAPMANSTCPPGTRADTFMFVPVPLWNHSLFEGCEFDDAVALGLGSTCVFILCFTILVDLAAATFARSLEVRKAMVAGAVSTALLLCAYAQVLGNPNDFVPGRAQRWALFGCYNIALGWFAAPGVVDLIFLRMVNSLPQGVGVTGASSSAAKAMGLGLDDLRRDVTIWRVKIFGMALMGVAAGANFAAAALAANDPYNARPASWPWQVACVFIGVAMACFMLSFHFGIRMFVRGLRSVLKSRQALGQQQDANVMRGTRELTAFVRRSEFFSSVPLLVLPVGCGVWLVGAFALPLSYIVWSVHMVNHCTGFGCLGVLLLPPRFWRSIPCSEYGGGRKSKVEGATATVLSTTGRAEEASVSA